MKRRYSGSSADQVEGVIDEVASELPITLVLNDEPLVTLLCTPAELEELAVGFLLSEGLSSRQVIHQKTGGRSNRKPPCALNSSDLPADFSTLFEKRTISSGCGKGVTFTNYRMYADRRIDVEGQLISLDDIRRLLHEFRNISIALSRDRRRAQRRALGRQRDPVLFRGHRQAQRRGQADRKGVSESVPVENKILLTSGRVTSEIMTKAGRNRFPILISRAAPSCMAISYAEDMGITLVGFARGDRMNIYTWPNRIKTD